MASALMFDLTHPKLLCAGMLVNLLLLGVGFRVRHWTEPTGAQAGTLLLRVLFVVIFASAAAFLCAATAAQRDFCFWLGFAPMLLWAFGAVTWPLLQADDIIAKGPGNHIPAAKLKFGFFYADRNDPALYVWISGSFVRGWNANIANRLVWVVMGVAALLALSPFLVLIFR